jgi:hypothetical protein
VRVESDLALLLINSVADSAGEESPEYLQLGSVGVQLETGESFISSANLLLPRALPRELGLQPQEA